MAPILEVKNLTHTYDASTPFRFDAVNDVSFSVEEGEIVGIIGHTGSGKSTLVQHLNGLLKPTSGNILFNGKDIWENPKAIKNIRANIGLVFQYPEYQLFEETVYKDIAFGPQNMGLLGEDLKTRVTETCQLLDIDFDYLEKSPFDLSGGEKRRVAIAGVMAMRPEVIIFDEPIAGLDPMGRKNVIKMIENYRNSFNATVLIISHNMEDMAQIADRLIVMNKGKLAKFDTTENVFSDAKFLSDIGLGVPAVTKIIDLLKSKGFNIEENILTIDDAVEALVKLKNGGNTYA
ncbi:MAG: energy-coupling factor transporter ATPase [Clostridia bacterium]|nr:energy-coupling factor transporter ATPase [Clostridia bacterium]